MSRLTETVKNVEVGEKTQETVVRGRGEQFLGVLHYLGTTVITDSLPNLIDYLQFDVPLKNFSLIWRRPHYR
jgi:hypothetical protein